MVPCAGRNKPVDQPPVERPADADPVDLQGRVHDLLRVEVSGIGPADGRRIRRPEFGGNAAAGQRNSPAAEAAVPLDLLAEQQPVHAVDDGLELDRRIAGRVEHVVKVRIGQAGRPAPAPGIRVDGKRQRQRLEKQAVAGAAEDDVVVHDIGPQNGDDDGFAGLATTSGIRAAEAEIEVDRRQQFPEAQRHRRAGNRVVAGNVAGWGDGAVIADSRRRAARFLPRHADGKRQRFPDTEWRDQRTAQVLAFAPRDDHGWARSAETFLPAVGDEDRRLRAFLEAGDDLRARLAQQVAPGVADDGGAMQPFGPRHGDGRALAAVGAGPVDAGRRGQRQRGIKRDARPRLGLGRHLVCGGGFGGELVGDLPGSRGVQVRGAVDGVVVVRQQIGL